MDPQKFGAKLQFTPPGKQSAIVCELEGDDVMTLRQAAERVIGGGARFGQSSEHPGTLLIYNDNHEGGKVPLGYIAPGDLKTHALNWITTGRLARAA